MEDKTYTKKEVIKIAWETRYFFHQNKDIPFRYLRESFRNFVEQFLK